MLGVMLALVVPSALMIVTQVVQFDASPQRHMPRLEDWYGHDSQAESLKNVGFRLETMNAIASLSDEIPASACVVSTVTEGVMLYTRRRTFRPPQDQSDLLALVARCPYVVMTLAKSSPHGPESFFPLAELRNELDLMAHRSTLINGAEEVIVLMGHAKPAPNAP